MKPEPHDPSDASELVTAYADGISELSSEDRARVERLLADDGATRAEVAAALDLIGRLRELAPDPAAGEPDWQGLERSISDAVTRRDSPATATGVPVA